MYLTCNGWEYYRVVIDPAIFTVKVVVFVTFSFVESIRTGVTWSGKNEDLCVISNATGECGVGNEHQAQQLLIKTKVSNIR